MLKETLSLLAAGYSKKEIDAMREADKKAEAEAAAKKAEDEKQAAAKKAEDDAKKAEADKQAESEASKKIAELEKQLAEAKEDLKKSQAGNVNNPIPADKKVTDEQKTTELLAHLAEYM
ncbi:MAG: hypothetical protein J6R22_03370 [Alphaproteobacteria bacterium]|nr:hypothetical protein [Alphaproteobacteria bacterium]